MLARPLPAPRAAVAAALALLLLLAWPSRVWTHEVPSRVAAHAVVRPAGHTLRVALRVPVEALRDLTLPLRDGVYLDVTRAEAPLREAARTWLADYLTLYEEGTVLRAPRVGGVRVSLPSDGAFARTETALAAAERAPLDSATRLPWKQAVLDVVLEYAIRDERARFSVAPRLAHLGMQTTVALRFVAPGDGGAERAFAFTGDPGLVRLDPRWHQAAARFVVMGVEHILDGIDHLLFVLCLVLPVRRVRTLVGVVTAFTVAHSITLAASALGAAPQALWFPPLVELLVALSIVYMAVENVVGVKVDRRWLVAFGFGLVHGFAFSFALADTMQFAGAHLATALLAFNVGVELGQLAVVALAVPALAWLFRRANEKVATLVLSVLVAHTAWHWMLERGAALGAHRLAWPALDRAFLAGAVRAGLLLLVVVSALWLLSTLADRLARARGGRGGEVGAD